MAVAGVSLLLVQAGAISVRERDPSGVVVSLVVAGGSYALLQWQWYLPHDYFGAEYVPASFINRLLPGLYIAAVVAGLVHALLCLLPLGGARQPSPFDAARKRAVGATFVFILCLYVLITGPSLLDVLPPWVPSTLKVGAGLSLLLLALDFWSMRNVQQRDMHGVGISLAVAAVAVALLWWRWQMPPGPGSAQINDMLPGLYIAALIAALVRALICARLFGGALRFIKSLREKRNKQPRPVSSSGSGFWADVRAAFMRGRTGRHRPTRPASTGSGFWADMRTAFERGRNEAFPWPTPLAAFWRRVHEVFAEEWR
jgi:hypothetical protein